MTRCSDPNSNQKKRKKRGKHVSFPPDEQIVSGFAEHAGRTEDSCMTLTDVVAAYRQSCSKHQVQPRENILQQLQVCYLLSSV
ncbi:hypothetical protein ATANTOWER_015841 [Ataeniobius toweri]|uniref:Uncharacterized protein n=1 Tax=Ataeniobius toweri TaxID=208326 RepID=A0ABU7A6M4_9TELE|nr:hypothetical protein [Ataeniobius toweri]